jgi:surface antigen
MTGIVLVSLLLSFFGVIGSSETAWAYDITCGYYGQTPSFACVSYTGYTGQQPWGYPVDANGHNCTNYVTYRLWQNGVQNPGNLGDAKDWDESATTYGIPVNDVPAVGAVAVWEAYSGPALADGHVAYVEAVTSTYIDISEDNYGGTTMRKRFYVGQSGWPDHFIHFADLSTTPSATPTYEAAFQSNTGNLYLYDKSGVATNTALGMESGTSPAVTVFADGNYETTFQDNQGNLWVYGSAGTTDTQLGMMATSSPSIDVLSGSGYETAFQSTQGQLWAYGSAGSVNTTLGMMPTTSPAIAGLSGGGYEIAFNAWQSGSLYLYNSSGGATNTTLGVMPDTSPSITSYTIGGYEVAFQASGSGNLYLYNPTTGATNTALGMMPGTSPSIAHLSDGNFEVAFQANDGSLYVYNSATGAINLQLGMMPGTSPSIIGLGGGGYELAFQDNQGNLWVYGGLSTGDTLLGMMSTTSPAMG